jgi:hypothetical protein
MARSPTETIRFLTLEELARLFAAVRASPRDRAQAVTPLIWDHVNPYGRFELDMDSRIPVLA